MKKLLSICLIFLAAFTFTLEAAAPKKKPATTKKKEAKPEKVDPVAFLKKNDEDNDGKLDKKELSAGLRSLKQNSVTTKNDSWKRFDTDGDGKLDQAEVTKMLADNK